MARARVTLVRSSPRGRAAVCGLALATCATQTHAHLIDTGLGPVYDGIAHFVLTPEDLVPALALAILAGMRGRDHARRAILTLPFAWLVGGVGGTLAGAPAIVAPTWLPLLVLGGLVALDARLPRGATTALSALLGFALGYGNGLLMAPAGPGLRGVVGVASAVFVVTTLVAASAAALQSGWLRIAWRVAGSWVAASGLLVLGWSIASA